MWLGASAITLGLGAAMASGTAMVHADVNTGATDTHSAATGTSSPAGGPSAPHPTNPSVRGKTDKTADAAPDTAPTGTPFEQPASLTPKVKAQKGTGKSNKADPPTTKTADTPAGSHVTAARTRPLASSTRQPSSSASAVKPTAAEPVATGENTAPAAKKATNTAPVAPVSSTPTAAIATAPTVSPSATSPAPTATTAATPVLQPGTGAPTVPVQAAALLVAATAGSTRQTPTTATAVATTTTAQTINPTAATTTSAATATSPSVLTTISINGAPVSGVMNTAGTRLYVVTGSNVGTAISVIDTSDAASKNTVIQTIPTADPISTLVVSPTGNKVYAGSATAGTVTVIDTINYSASAPIQVGTRATGTNTAPPAMFIVPTPDLVYVATGSNNTVSVLSAKDNTIVDTIALHAPPTTMAINADGSYLYVGASLATDGTSGVVRVIKATGIDVDTVVYSAVTPAAPSAMVFSADGTKLYVASNYNSFEGPGSYLTTFDTATMAPIPATGSTYNGSAALDKGLQTTSMIAAGNNLYLTQFAPTPSGINTGQVVVFDTKSNAVTTAIPFTNGTPTQLAVSPDGSRVYINLMHLPTTSDITTYTTSVAIIDPTTNALVGQPLSAGPSSAGTFVLKPDGTRIYVMGPLASAVTVIDTGQAATTGGPSSGGGSSNYQPSFITALQDWAAAVAKSETVFLTQFENSVHLWISTVTDTVTSNLKAWGKVIQQWLVGGVPPSGPESPSQALYDYLRTVTEGTNVKDGIYVETRELNGQKLLVVYLGGTLSSPNQGVPQNLPAAGGDLKPEQIDAVERALNGDTTIPIMLVGFSQGGMDAQNMAIKADFRGQVTAVVTYAAPMVEVMPKTLTFIDLVDKGDPVPHLLSTSQPYYSTAESNGQIFEFESPNDSALINLFNKLHLHGDRTTYEQVGQAFDKAVATNDQYAQVRNNIDFFMSGIVQPDFTTGA